MIKHVHTSKWGRRVILSSLIILLSGCANRASQPLDYQNICDIFSSHKKWYREAQKSTQRWGGNMQLPMAIIFQESSFKAKARPKRKKILGVLPGSRPSDAYGYSQALKSTWKEYQQQTGRRYARRDRFADSFDFVQWYINRSHTINNVSKWDYSNQYLNYHEGHGGYKRQTYLKKNWLLATSKRVKSRAERYSKQLSSCQTSLS